MEEFLKLPIAKISSDDSSSISQNISTTGPKPENELEISSSLSKSSPSRSGPPPRKTREELNLIEKERTFKINCQILSLRSLLENSKIDTKKDKFSVIRSSYQYLEQLKTKLHQLEIVKERLHSFKRTSVGGINRKNLTMCMESELEFKNYFVHASTGLILVDLDGKFLSFNPYFLRLSGHSSEALKRMSLFNLTYPEDVDLVLKSIKALAVDSKMKVIHFKLHFRFFARDQECSITMWLIRHRNGKDSVIEFMIVPVNICTGAKSCPAAISNLCPDRLLTENQREEIFHFRKNNSSNHSAASVKQRDAIQKFYTTGRPCDDRQSTPSYASLSCPLEGVMEPPTGQICRRSDNARHSVGDFCTSSNHWNSNSAPVELSFRHHGCTPSDLTTNSPGLHTFDNPFCPLFDLSTRQSKRLRIDDRCNETMEPMSIRMSREEQFHYPTSHHSKNINSGFNPDSFRYDPF